MAEALGEAVLILRTDDSALAAGVSRAEGQAQKLGGTLDRASGSSTRLAGEMLRSGQSAEQMGRGFSQAGAQVEASANAQRNSLQNLGFQLNDVATMFALGASPMQIFAAQGGQIIQVLQQMAGASAQSGGAAEEAGTDIEGMGDKVLETADKAKDMGGKLGAVASFLGGPWGIAITVALTALSPFIGRLFEAEDALEGVEFASSKLGDAQAILGGVLDKTTGQINTQSQALLALARAQAIAGRIGAQQRQAAARSELDSISRGNLGDLRIEGSIGGARIVRAETGAGIVDAYRNGQMSAAEAERRLRSFADKGIISQDAYFRAAQAITSDALEAENVKVFDDAQAALSGDTGAARRIFGPQGGSGGGRGGGGGRARSGPAPRSEAERAADFDRQAAALQRDTLQAQLDLATSAEERAGIQVQLLDLEREQRLAEIEASDLGKERKAALIAQTEALLGVAPKIDEQGNLIVSANIGLEGQIIVRERIAQMEREAEALAEEEFRAKVDALQLQLQLADTDAERKAIALKILEAEEANLNSKLNAVISSKIAEDAEKERAQRALDAQAATADTRRAAVGRQNETELERYLRRLNATPGQINEALQGIQIDGLEALNDGLTQAILGAESLGDVFSRVADQIIADLLRIAVQQAIIRPLANALFGGGEAGGGGLFGSIFGGGGGSGLVSTQGQNLPGVLRGFGGGFGGALSLFAGLFAEGGTIPTGQFGIVGEQGPELAFAGPGGLGILSNPESRKLLTASSGGPSVMIPITIDATGADAAAIARLNSRLDRLREELPGTIVSTVRDAQDRRVI
jgi:hypothetical protein